MLTDANKKSNSKSSKKSKKKGVKNAKKCKKNAFFCEICNYTSNRKTEYKRHLTTKKHKTNTSRLEYFNEHPDLDTNMLKPLFSKQKSSEKNTYVHVVKYMHIILVLLDIRRNVLIMITC